jgi:hypothetical protein
MVRFELNECSIELTIQPLTGALATADRQVAWQIYLALVTRSTLRGTQLPEADVRDLIEQLQRLLDRWPAGEVEAPSATHLGFAMVGVIEMILMPCVTSAKKAPSEWAAVRSFCQELASDIAKTYAFPDASAAVPRDLRAAWGMN